MTHVRPVSKLKSFVVGASSSIPKNSYLKILQYKSQTVLLLHVNITSGQSRAQQTMNMFRFRRIRNLLLERPGYELHMTQRNRMKKLPMKLYWESLLGERNGGGITSQTTMASWLTPFLPCMV